MVAVKICGLSEPETLDAAVAAGASHVGFVFYPPSPRNLSLGQAAALSGRVPQQVERVAVLVDPDDALVEAVVSAVPLEVLQLHGVSPQRAKAIGQRISIEIWCAVAVRTSADVGGAVNFRGAADRLLYDAKTPAGSLPGGMGVRFDWRLLSGVRHALPWGLSGGLDADVVGEAVAATGARLLDVSSGVESAPGVKDVDKIRRFLQAAQAL